MLMVRHALLFHHWMVLKDVKERYVSTASWYCMEMDDIIIDIHVWIINVGMKPYDTLWALFHTCIRRSTLAYSSIFLLTIVILWLYTRQFIALRAHMCFIDKFGINFSVYWTAVVCVHGCVVVSDQGARACFRVRKCMNDAYARMIIIAVSDSN